MKRLLTFILLTLFVPLVFAQNSFHAHLKPIAASASYVLETTDPSGALWAMKPDSVNASGGSISLATPMRVFFHCSGNDASIVFHVTGTDRYGNACIDSITGASGSYVYSAKVFKTVTSLGVSDDSSEITAGVGRTYSRPIRIDNPNVSSVAYAGHVANGSMYFKFQGTLDDIWNKSEFDDRAIQWHDLDASASTAVMKQSTMTYSAVRVSIDTLAEGESVLYWNVTPVRK